MIEIGNVKVIRKGIHDYEIRYFDNRKYSGCITVNTKYSFVQVQAETPFSSIPQGLWDIYDQITRHPRSVIEFYRTYTMKRRESR